MLRRDTACTFMGIHPDNQRPIMLTGGGGGVCVKYRHCREGAKSKKHVLLKNSIIFPQISLSTSATLDQNNLNITASRHNATAVQARQDNTRHLLRFRAHVIIKHGPPPPPPRKKSVLVRRTPGPCTSVNTGLQKRTYSRLFFVFYKNCPPLESIRRVSRSSTMLLALLVTSRRNRFSIGW